MKHFLRPYVVSGLVVVAGLGALAGGVADIQGHAQGLRIGQLWHETSLLMHTASQSYLGVDVSDLDQDRATALHLKDTRGAEITILDHDAPAGKVGLKLHDVILQLNGQTVENADQVKRLLRETPVGHKVELVVSRDGAQLTVTAQMANRRKVQEAAREQIGTGGGTGAARGFFSGSGGGDAPTGSGFHIWGFGSSLNVGALVEPLTPQMADFLGVSSGLMIKSVAHKSAADAAGLKAHDVILQIGGESVVTSSDWERLLRSSQGKPVQVEILRDRAKQLMLLQVDGKKPKA